MKSQYFGSHIIQIDRVSSTNNYAAKLLNQTKIPFGAVIMAQFQDDGRGQRGAVWQSKSGENLLFSAILDGSLMKECPPFFLSKCVAVSIKDTLSYFLKHKIHLKWPNDVLVERRKIAGVLIESQWKGNNLFSSIIGVGLNVNQTHFEYGFDATSMKLLSANDYDLKEVLQVLCTKLNFNFNRLLSKEYSDLQQDYLSSLYKYNEKTHFKIGDKLEEVVLKDVNENGMVSLEMLGGKIKEYDFSQARQII
jgi:BirA family biotin operon repressor/biotin-[acetyl-CoA-carboxylase] ligase